MDWLSTEIILGIVFAVMLAVAVLIWHFYTKAKKSADPIRAAKRVHRALSGFANIRKYRVLSDVQLGNVKIDHIMVGYFGMLLVSDLAHHGYYYGKIDDSRWVCSDPPEMLEKGETLNRVHIGNPLPQTDEAMRILRERLSKSGIYKVQMESIAVIADKSSVVQITGAKNRVMNIKGLSALLSHSKYSSDTGLDVDKICKVILE